MFPPKCGNWAHIPIDIPKNDQNRQILTTLGFRYGRLCKRNDSVWQHIHPPKGWYCAKGPRGEAQFWDNNGHERINVFLPAMTGEKQSRIVIRRYHSINCASYEEDDLGFVTVDICNPDDDVVYHGFKLVPLRLLKRHKTRMYVMTRTMWEVYSMFLLHHPHATSPCAYWEIP